MLRSGRLGLSRFIFSWSSWKPAHIPSPKSMLEGWSPIYKLYELQNSSVILMPQAFPCPSLFILLHHCIPQPTGGSSVCIWDPFEILINPFSELDYPVMALLIQESTVCTVREVQCSLDRWCEHWWLDPKGAHWSLKILDAWTLTSGQIWYPENSWNPVLQLSCISNYLHLNIFEAFEAGGAVDAYQSLSRRCIWWYQWYLCT